MFNFLSGLNSSMFQGLNPEALAFGAGQMPDLMSGAAPLQAGLQAGTNPINMPGMDQMLEITNSVPFMNQASLDPGNLLFNGNPLDKKTPFNLDFLRSRSQQPTRQMTPPAGAGIGRMSPIGAPMLLPMANLRRR